MGFVIPKSTPGTPGPTVQQSMPAVRAAAPEEEGPSAIDLMLLDQVKRMNSRERKPMYSPEEAQGRRDANDREYRLGLAASLSGNDNFADTGGVVLKNVLAQRQPKVTEHGSADPESGAFTYN